MKLPRWFQNRLHTIMKHNDYSEDMITVAICEPKDKWTPTDLILREYYNNGGGSSRGFLGISCKECIRCYEFILQNQQELKAMDYYSKTGYNNWGFKLWDNWKVH